MRCVHTYVCLACESATIMLMPSLTVLGGMVGVCAILYQQLGHLSMAFPCCEDERRIT